MVVVGLLAPCEAWVFFLAYPGLRPDWRPGLRPGLFSFAPSGLGFGGRCLSYGGVRGILRAHGGNALTQFCRCEQTADPSAALGMTELGGDDRAWGFLGESFELLAVLRFSCFGSFFFVPVGG